MTTPGALPARPSLLDVPPVPPEDMTDEENEAWVVAQVAAITLAAAAARKQIADSITIQLVGMLRLINPYNSMAISRFAAEAAALVSAGIAETGYLMWSAVNSRLEVQGFPLSGRYVAPADGRTTELQVAYQRVAADYRRRVAAGPESIATTIAQAEEERFQAIGGAVVAEGRRGESNAEVQGTSRSSGSGASAKRTSGTGSSGSQTAGGGSSSAGRSGDRPTVASRADKQVNTTADDREGEADGEPTPGDTDDPVAAEQELRREAALSDGEKNRILEQVAQQEMEVRLERMVNDDIGMAARSGFQKAVQAAPKGVVVGYRRVIHPELSETGTCGLCIAASTRIYQVKELMPIHNLCKCEPVEVTRDRDVGGAINDEDLDVLYGEAGDSTHRTDLSNTKWTVFDHPELGPVLRSVPRSKKREPVDIDFSSRESASDRGGQS